MKKTLIVISLVLLGVLMSCALNDSNFLNATDSSVFIQGRSAEVEKQSLDFAYPGVSVTIKVKAKSVSAVLKDLDGGRQNYFNVIVDGEVVKTLAITEEKESYLLIDDLDESVFHTIQLFKRTESFVGITRLYGFEFTDLKEIINVEKPVKKLLVIGDSFSCGYGNGVEITAENNPEVGFHAKNENNYMAYGALASRKLNYQYQCIAYSGKGLYRNFDLTKTGTLPDIFPLIFPDKPNGQKWEMTKYIPDVIVVKLGTNDFFGETRTPVQMVDSSAYVSTYLNFLSELEKTFPKAQFICVVGGMMSDSWPAGRNNLSKIGSYVHNVVSEANSRSNRDKFHFLEFPHHQEVYGEDWHPTISWHMKYADLLVNKVEGI